MFIPGLLLSTGLMLVFLFAVFRPLELAFPAKKQQMFFRPEWFTDLLFFLGQFLLWNGIVIWCLVHVRSVLSNLVPRELTGVVAAQPLWLQIVEVILLTDFCIYWGHRLQHRVGFLWRFHSVHHSAEHLDWLAAHREHPLDTIYTVTLINLPAMFLGFSLESLAGFIAFRGVWAVYIHSNVRLPLGPLRILLGAPELHHWHHARDRDAGNYGNLCPLMDVIFGTHICPPNEPEAFGIDDATPRSYLGHMVQPLLLKTNHLEEPPSVNDSAAKRPLQETTAE